MGDVLFMTGATGFLGKRLLKKYLAEDNEAYLLVQDKFREPMLKFLDEEKTAGAMKAKVEMVTGDITAPGLGLPPEKAEEIACRATTAYHLAAAYRLNMPLEPGKLINVEGTRNTLDFLGRFRALKRFGYFSTTAISGTHSGAYLESDFNVGQQFKNHYESTKFEAEKLVRERMDSIPTTIFRPTIIVGDSRTGEMEKIDGPYYAMVMVSRRLHAVMQKSSVPCNIEPADFVIDAIHAIMGRGDAAGLTVHIADPNPPTYDEFFDLLFDRWNTFRPLLKLPPRMMLPMFSIPGFSALTGVPKESFLFVMDPIRYGAETMERLLEGTGIACPRVEEYIDVMIKYFRERFDRGLDKMSRW